MFLTIDGRTLDFDLQFVEQLLTLLDAHLGELRAAAAHSPDADAFGFYDSEDYLIGIGFVACQGYLATTSGEERIEKAIARKAGPAHRSGYTIAEIINSAANHWKHRDEWAGARTAKRKEKTNEILDALDLPETASAFGGVLAELVLARPTRLSALLPHLEAWRDAMAGSAPP
jgi:hypothetical protein